MNKSIPIISIVAVIALQLELAAVWSQNSDDSGMAQTDQPLSDQDFESLISRLDASRPAQERINAAIELGKLQSDPRSLTAVDALKAGWKDSEDEVRWQSLFNLTLILRAHGKECPAEIFEFVKDENPKIKTNLPYLLDFYDKYPAEALPYCLQYYAAIPDQEKSNALMLLGRSG